MAEKKTHAERVAAKMATGMSMIDAEIEVTKAEAEERVKALRAKQAKEEARIDAEVLRILETEQADAYASVRKRAERNLAAAARERSQRAKGAEAKQEAQPTAPDPHHEQQYHGGQPS